MCDATELVKEILYGDHFGTLSSLHNSICNAVQVQNVYIDPIIIVDTEFLNDVKKVMTDERIRVFFSNTLKDLKIVITDEIQRNHSFIIRYEGPKKLVIISAELPCSALQTQTFSSLLELLQTIKGLINDLQGYFQELEGIDKYCTIVDPVNCTFKDDYRRIALDERTWLHIEVTTDGRATNVHLVGQSETFQEKLQTGLLQWDHDMDIVDNITRIFDLPQLTSVRRILSLNNGSADLATDKQPEPPRCSICLCQELLDLPGLAQPLCQNVQCGVYFHRDCLFQWLVACAGGRPPAFGVATGSCPNCFQPVACNQSDS